MVQRILLASGNAKKLAELRALCQELPVEILSPADLPLGLPNVIEDGTTFLANARKKAMAAALVAADQLGDEVWALADDSGLCVDALDGTPGVWSARYATVGQNGAESEQGNAPDSANNEKLLQELKDYPAERRGAAFHCVIVVARAKVNDAPQAEVLFHVDGSVRGKILDAADGSQGFGYDPLFWHEESGCSFGRLSGEQKAGVSHRGHAVRQLKELLLDHFRKER